MPTSDLVTCVVVSWNGRELLRKCLSIFYQNTTNVKCGVVVVDNASNDGSARMLNSDFPSVHVIRNDRNEGFSVANNQGIRYALARGSKYVLLLNNDIEVTDPNWLQKLIAVMESDSKTGVVGCKLLYPDGRIQHAGGVVAIRVPYNRGEEQIDRGQYNRVEFMDFVTGAVLVIRSDVIRQIGLLDEGFSPLYCEDTDWCLRAKLYGYKVAYTPDPTLIHQCGSSSSKLGKERRAFLFKRSFVRFYLLNYQVKDILKRIALYESREIIRCFIVRGRGLPVTLRSDTASRLRVFADAWLPSLRNLKEITGLRRQRFRFGNRVQLH
ncbi:glycosyltransferase family 2 protein [Candidatus Bathyarchaeota archaeon]|nr:glycosyltransferase family 2 protein [Candidatus Bathyarchaeota archaeon]